MRGNIKHSSFSSSTENLPFTQLRDVKKFTRFQELQMKSMGSKYGGDRSGEAAGTHRACVGPRVGWAVAIKRGGRGN